jgi:hypothetical protein
MKDKPHRLRRLRSENQVPPGHAKGQIRLKFRIATQSFCEAFIVVVQDRWKRSQIGSLLGVLDRRDKDAITLVFAAIQKRTSVKVNENKKEIEKADFQTSLPKKASPSAKYFWSARRGRVKKIRKIRAANHQFPPIV